MKNSVTIFGLFLFITACSGPRESQEGRGNWAFAPAQRLESANPVLEPEKRSKFYCPIEAKTIRWEEKDVFNPAVVLKDGRVWMLYRAEDKRGKHNGTSRIGLANSRDGKDFKKVPTPVLYPDDLQNRGYEWEGGCEDPRVVQTENGRYVMTYTAYDGKTARLCIATSNDLYAWEKHGPAFPEKGWKDRWSKSGAILCRMEDGKAIAEKMHDTYWMYWGDREIYLARSADLINWEVVRDKRGQPIPVLGPRQGSFDSQRVEPGPYALHTPQGILLLYNGCNDQQRGDSSLPHDAYSVGQALFSVKKPERLIGRRPEPLLRPERVYEQEGQKDNVCFLTGMIYFNNRWLLYYGAADSRIGVAESR